MYFFFSITFSCGADSSIFFKVPMICMDQQVKLILSSNCNGMIINVRKF